MPLATNHGSPSIMTVRTGEYSRHFHSRSSDCVLEQDEYSNSVLVLETLVVRIGRMSPPII